jgi:PAS domain S-box-containing protein
VHPDDAACSRERWQAALESGEIYEAEFRLQRRDGAYRWHLARALPIHSADRRIKRWIGTNTDIHERKLAEAQSTRDRDRIWSLSQELMLVCDFRGVVVAANPAATRLLGWSEEELVGRNLVEFVHPDDWARTAAEIRQLAHGMTTLAFENRYRTKDGGHRLLDWAAVPESGHIHAVGRDITLERASAAERERIWNSTNDLMGTVGPDGLLRSVNPAWSRLLGYNDAEMLGRPFSALLAAEDRDAIAGVIERLAAGESVRDLEDSLVHADGRRSLIAWSAEPFDGVFYIVGRNVTEQRAAEEALRQSQKMEAVGQLTGGIAHDFNNLLQGITGSLALIQKRIAQGHLGELDRFIGGAMNSANRAAALTHRLLAFSRRQPLDPRAVSANPLIESMEDMLRRTLGERINLKFDLGAELWPTMCDPNQLESAILNLVINARDAMPDGGSLTIATCNLELEAGHRRRPRDVQPGEYVRISVTDTGTGMSADTISKAFEPFFTTKPIGQGTGLGLSMIYGFARQSGGSVKIDSEVGSGTTVLLYLPRHQGATRAEDPVRPPDITRPSKRNETVLVVEDEPVVRSLIVEVLNDLGYHALEAGDGPAGLAILESKRRIDLLITDIGLPGMNGRQIAEVARQSRPNFRVLFMTGYAENAAAASGFLEKGMSMITKPFAMDMLALRIRESLEEPVPAAAQGP